MLMRLVIHAIFCGVAVLAFVRHGQVSANDPKAPKFVLTWGKKGKEPGEFHSPISIAINKKDEIFVSDLNNSRVQKFDVNGKHLGGFELPADSPPRKSCMVGGMTSDGDGLLYVSFMIKHKLAVYTEEGKLVREWGNRGAGDGEFNQPGGIVLRPDGTLFVTDQCNHRVQKFTTEGKFLAKWGEHGDQPGQFGAPEFAGSRFGGPHFLSQDSQGRLFTTEGVPGRVQQFTADGKSLLAWGDKTQKPGGFGALATGYSKHTFSCIGILVDKHDRVWVSSLNDRVQQFTLDGKFVRMIGGSGDGPGQFARPHGMAFDSKGFFYVADAGNERIQKFEVPPP